MKTFSFKDRKENLQKIRTVHFDLFVVGGGINGAGVARDAALRGMSVGLVEGHDFASGTSSRSSKLIHGGIRYLENMEFKLVFEALSERQKLFELAPHLSHPLRFMIPLYKSGRVGMFKMGLGMWLYDALSLFQAPEMHERLNVNKTKERMPSLQSADLLGSFVYSDAYMDDDRLVIETLRSANEAGAVCVNYVKAISGELDSNGKLISVICEDQKSKEKFKVYARHFVSSVGPWTDIFATSLFEKWKKILRPTKGVHLTFRKDRLPLACAVVMGAEKRIVFGIPRHEMVIVGTTDTDFQGDPSQVSTTAEDVKYLLSVIDQYFPGAKIKESDIVASYAGVRPLVQDEAESEGKTSREHTIFTEEHGITFVAGGKYTTYRLMSEQVVEECLKSFPLEERVRFNRGQSEQPLNSYINVNSRMQDDLVLAEIMRTRALSKQEATLLVERHGLEAREIIKKFGPDSYWALEAEHAIENTMCLHLVDFFTRRVPLILAEQDHGLSVMPMVSAIFAQKLNWSASEKALEESLLQQHIERELAWRQNKV